jgi:hypothetical protein
LFSFEMSLQPYSGRAFAEEDSAVAQATAYAVSLIAAGCADLEQRTAQWVNTQLAACGQASAVSAAQVVQSALQLARAEWQQQQQQQAHQQQAQLSAGLMNVATQGIENTTAATAALYATLQQEIGVLRHLVADLRTSQEELKALSSHHTTDVQFLSDDVVKCVAEIQRGVERVHAAENAIKKGTREAKAESAELGKNLKETKRIVHELVDDVRITKEVADDLRAVTSRMEADHQARAAAMTRLEERIESRMAVLASRSSLQRVEHAVEALASTTAEEVEELKRRLAVQQTSPPARGAQQQVSFQQPPNPQVAPLASPVRNHIIDVDAQPASAPPTVAGVDVSAAILTLADALRPRRETEVDPSVFSLAHISTWPVLLEEGWSIFELTFLRLLPASSETAREEVNLLLQWCKSYFGAGSYAWPLDKPTQVLAESLLRRARIASAAVPRQSIAAAMTKHDYAGDPLGAAIANASKTNSKASPKKGRSVTCWYCAAAGHSAHVCKARIAAGAPVPTGPRTTTSTTAAATSAPPPKPSRGNGVGGN